MRTLPFVSSVEAFKANVNYLDRKREEYRAVAEPGKVAAWYATRDVMDPHRWLFGPSRFVGYEGMKATDYGSGEVYVHGSETERYLQRSGWFTLAEESGSLFVELHKELSKFLASIDSAPRIDVRINVLTEDLSFSEKPYGHIFISYSHETPEPTKKLAMELQQRGYRVWWDTNLIGGEFFDDKLRAQLEAAAAVVVIWTKTTVNSLNVKSEAARALRGNKLICARSPDVTLDDLPMPYDQLHLVYSDDIVGIIAGLKRHGVRSSSSYPSDT
jgi:TIR domain